MVEESILEAVAPRVGAWIETVGVKRQKNSHESLPVWERGLKLPTQIAEANARSRSPCGSVD